MVTDQEGAPRSWLSAPIMQSASDIALGAILVVAGSIAIWNFPVSSFSSFSRWDQFGPVLYPNILGGLLVVAGVCLMIRGCFLVPSQPRRWGFREMMIILFVICIAQLVVRNVWSREWMLLFGPSEFAALIIFQLAVALALARLSHLRAFGTTLLGLLLGIVGTDLASGRPRFTFGLEALEDGIALPMVLLGLFVVADGIICLLSPSMFRDAYARQVAGWTAPKLTAVAEIGMRIVAAGAVAAACYYVFNLSFNALDIGLLIASGLFGIACRIFDWNRLLLLLAFSQSALLEEQFRRAMMIARNDLLDIVQRPITGTLLFLACALVAVAVLYRFRVIHFGRRQAQLEN